MFLSAITERRISVDGDWRIRSPEARAVHRAVCATIADPGRVPSCAGSGAPWSYIPVYTCVFPHVVL